MKQETNNMCSTYRECVGYENFHEFVSMRYRLLKRTKLRAMYDKGKEKDSSILYISCAIIHLSYFVSNFVPSTYSIINIIVHSIIK